MLFIQAGWYWLVGHSPANLIVVEQGACEKGRANLRNNIKKKQIDVALREGNTSMLIWVGKQWCGQRDSRHEVEHKGDVVINVKHYGSHEPKQWGVHA